MGQVIATIHGRFTDFEGTIEAGAALDEAQIDGVVRASSLTTDHEQRDEHLRSVELLDAAAHPEIRFESERIQPISDDALRIAGRLELKGESQPVELDATVLGTGEDQHGAVRLALAAEGSVDFGPMRIRILADVSTLKEET